MFNIYKEEIKIKIGNNTNKNVEMVNKMKSSNELL